MRKTLCALSMLIGTAISALVFVPRANAGGAACVPPDPCCRTIISTSKAVPFSGFLIAQQPADQIPNSVIFLTMAITNSVTWFKPGAVVRFYGPTVGISTTPLGDLTLDQIRSLVIADKSRPLAGQLCFNSRLLNSSDPPGSTDEPQLFLSEGVLVLDTVYTASPNFVQNPDLVSVRDGEIRGLLVPLSGLSSP